MSKSFDRLSKALAKTLGISSVELIESFKPATESDLEKVVAFRKLFFTDGLKWDDRDYLRWRYSFSDNTADSHGRYWLLKVKDDILGTIGMESFELVLNGEVKQACHPLDLMTKPELKGVGIGAWLNLALIQKSPIVFVLGSSEEAEGLVRKIYHPLPDCISWKLPINILGSLKHKLNVPGVVPLLAAVWNSYSAISRTVRFKGLMPENAAVRQIDRFDQAVNQLSEESGIAGIFRFRSAEYLNWRFIDNPCTNYIALGLYANDMRLMAFSICHFIYSPVNRQQEAVIDDIFWSSDANNQNGLIWAKAMLAETVEHAVRSDAKLIQIAVCSEPFSRTLDSLGFFPRGSGSVCGVYAADPVISKQVYNDKLWFITEGDAHGEYYEQAIP